MTKFPDHGVDYNHELVGVQFTVRRETDDWRSIKVFKDSDVRDVRRNTLPGDLTLTEEFESRAP